MPHDPPPRNDHASGLRTKTFVLALRRIGILRQAWRTLRALPGRVPTAAPIVRRLDALYTRMVAQERYVGGEVCWDYMQGYMAVILPQTRGRVLDLGCGHGYITREIAERVEVTQVVGIDKILDFRCPHSKVTYRTQDLVVSPRLPDGFDIIVATDFIEHIPEAALLTLLPSVRDALRDGGIFIGSTPANHTQAATYSGSPYHVREYQPAVLQAYFERYFIDVRLEQRPQAVMIWSARKRAAA
jgi:SAM-dependent methyltransferase